MKNPLTLAGIEPATFRFVYHKNVRVNPDLFDHNLRLVFFAWVLATLSRALR